MALKDILALTLVLLALGSNRVDGKAMGDSECGNEDDDFYKGEEYFPFVPECSKFYNLEFRAKKFKCVLDEDSYEACFGMDGEDDDEDFEDVDDGVYDEDEEDEYEEEVETEQRGILKDFKAYLGIGKKISKKAENFIKTERRKLASGRHGSSSDIRPQQKRMKDGDEEELYLPQRSMANRDEEELYLPQRAITDEDADELYIPQEIQGADQDPMFLQRVIR